VVVFLPKGRWQCVNDPGREAGGGYGCIPLEKGHVYNYDIITAAGCRAFYFFKDDYELYAVVG
jgi:hypothetical protein